MTTPGAARGYRTLCAVGRGSFGEALLVRDPEGAVRVIKAVNVGRMGERGRKEADEEVAVFSSLRHPYVIRYRESFLDDGILAIVMDFAEGGDLLRRIRRAREAASPFSEHQVLTWFTQSLLGTKYLHSLRLVHRDLKSENFLLTREGTLVLGDFGLTRALPKDADFFAEPRAVGTPYYLAPEVFKEGLYSCASDVWGLGCVLFEMAALRVPFEAQTIAGLSEKVVQGPLPTIPSAYSAAMAKLFLELLRRERQRRPGAAEVLRRPLIQSEARRMLREAKDRRARSAGASGGGAASWRAREEGAAAAEAGGKAKAAAENRAASVGAAADGISALGDAAVDVALPGHVPPGEGEEEEEAGLLLAGMPLAVQPGPPAAAGGGAVEGEAEVERTLVPAAEGEPAGAPELEGASPECAGEEPEARRRPPSSGEVEEAKPPPREVSLERAADAAAAAAAAEGTASPEGAASAAPAASASSASAASAAGAEEPPAPALPSSPSAALGSDLVTPSTSPDTHCGRAAEEGPAGGEAEAAGRGREEEQEEEEEEEEEEEQASAVQRKAGRPALRLRRAAAAAAAAVALGGGAVCGQEGRRARQRQARASCPRLQLQLRPQALARQPSPPPAASRERETGQHSARGRLARHRSLGHLRADVLRAGGEPGPEQREVNAPPPAPKAFARRSAALAAGAAAQVAAAGAAAQVAAAAAPQAAAAAPQAAVAGAARPRPPPLWLPTGPGRAWEEAWPSVRDRAGTPRAGTPRAGTPRAGTPRGCTPRGCTPRGCTPRGCTPRGAGRLQRSKSAVTLKENVDPQQPPSGSEPKVAEQKPAGAGQRPAAREENVDPQQPPPGSKPKAAEQKPAGAGQRPAAREDGLPPGEAAARGARGAVGAARPALERQGSGQGPHRLLRGKQLQLPIGGLYADGAPLSLREPRRCASAASLPAAPPAPHSSRPRAGAAARELHRVASAAALERRNWPGRGAAAPGPPPATQGRR